MSYQEVLIKSSIIPLEKISGIIQRASDPMFIDSADTVATLRDDFTSNKMIIFGRQVNVGKVHFKAGEKFLVVCGEREAVDSIKHMFPGLVKIYPMELVMCSEQNQNKNYEDVFADTMIATQEKQKRNSIRQKLFENKGQIDRNRTGSESPAKAEMQIREKSVKSHDER